MSSSARALSVIFHTVLPATAGLRMRAAAVAPRASARRAGAAGVLRSSTRPSGTPALRVVSLTRLQTTVLPDGRVAMGRFLTLPGLWNRGLPLPFSQLTQQ